MYVYLDAIYTNDSLMRLLRVETSIAETYVGVTNIPYLVNNSCALVGLT
jgi:hypothetical protein